MECEFELPSSVYIHAERKGHQIGWKQRLFDPDAHGN
jgi:hypothetical protein